MEREILFKALSKDRQWLFGKLVDFRSCDQWCLAIQSPIEGEKRSIRKIDPKTVCQFTGLTDKNGTKIFEGDFFDDDEPGLILVVVWCEKLCQFTVDIRNKSEPKTDVGIDGFKNVSNLYDLIDHNEIIGNIHHGK